VINTWGVTWKSKFTKIGIIIKYLRTLSINRVCVPYAYSMHVRALAAPFFIMHGPTNLFPPFLSSCKRVELWEQWRENKKTCPTNVLEGVLSRSTDYSPSCLPLSVSLSSISDFAKLMTYCICSPPRTHTPSYAYDYVSMWLMSTSPFGTRPPKAEGDNWQPKLNFKT
jgi:hypothetical protein